MNQSLNLEKLKAVAHYVCHKASDPSVLGAIKLNKVLWYSDAISYLISGSSITGETYVKRQHGPVPCHVPRVIDSLIREGKIVRGKVDHFGFMKTEYIALKEPGMADFSGEEVAIIDAAFEHVCLDNTAKSISEQTHSVIWGLANMGEQIPYEAAVFASNVGEIDETDMNWAYEKHGSAIIF